MSKVTNEAKIKNPIIGAVREQLEHRAFWLYLLCDEAGRPILVSRAGTALVALFKVIRSFSFFTTKS